MVRGEEQVVVIVVVTAATPRKNRVVDIGAGAERNGVKG
jgi:hypothetical protein